MYINPPPSRSAFHILAPMVYETMTIHGKNALPYSIENLVPRVGHVRMPRGKVLQG